VEDAGNARHGGRPNHTRAGMKPYKQHESFRAAHQVAHRTPDGALLSAPRATAARAIPNTRR
jgi:hypothetical protein